MYFFVLFYNNDLNGLIKSTNLSVTTNENGLFSINIPVSSKKYIFTVKESTSGIVMYSYNNNTCTIVRFIYNWAGNKIPNKTFNITIYYIELK